MLMREMVRSGHRCVVLTSNSTPLTVPPEVLGRELVADIEGVEMHWIRTLKYQRAKSIRRILSWLDFEWQLWRLPKKNLPRPDAIIVSSLSILTILNGLWLKRKYRCRLIFEVRDIWPLTIIEEGGFSARNPIVMGLRWLEKLAYRKADAIVGTMPNLGQHVAESVSHPAPVYCIPMGIAPEAVEQVTPVPSEWIEAHVPRDKFIVCHAGTIGITNALDTLFDCARLMRNDPNVHFLIVGEGGLQEHYQSICSDLPNVTFTGPVPKDMVQSVLSLCDLLYFSVHVSKVWKYGLSLNKVIDYMLIGKPIVASYTGYPTMVDEAGSGSSVPAGDPAALKSEIMRYVAMPPTQRADIGAKGRTWLLHHRPFRKLADDYLKILLPGYRSDAAGVTDQPTSAIR